MKELKLNLDEKFFVVGEGEEFSAGFDWEGRLLNAYEKGITFKRGLDNRLLRKNLVNEVGRGRKEISFLTGEEKRKTIERIYERAKNILVGIRKGGRISGNRGLLPLAIETLNKKGFPQLEEEGRALKKIYSKVGILPPDRYFSLLIQLTEGCHWNRCSFCTFYHGVKFRIKTKEEFEEHAVKVRKFINKGLSVRRGIFLGDANALIVPRSYLEERIEVLRRVFPEENLSEYYSFFDIFTKRKENGFFESLGKMGFKKIYIGLETASKKLLKVLEKPGDPKDALEIVKRIRDGGAHVGIIILVGVSPPNLIEEHIEETTKLVERMSLEKEDIIYLSLFIKEFGRNYEESLRKRGMNPPGEEHSQKELEKFKFFFSQFKAKVSLYDIREFLY